MVNDLIIKKEYIERFKKMIEGIRDIGFTHICPLWKITLLNDPGNVENCDICLKYFNKSRKEKFNVIGACPCKHYTPAYLIRFLRRVITNSQ